MLKFAASSARPALNFKPSVLAKASAVRFAHPISNPTIAGLSQRWEKLPKEEQADIVDLLSERQKVSWKELSLNEKKAAWYISYGAWGPRTPIHKPGDVKFIILGTLAGLAAALALFASVRTFGGEEPKTLSREWQEETNKYLKSKNAEPFSGGVDYIQSPSKGPLDVEEDDDDE